VLTLITVSKLYPKGNVFIDDKSKNLKSVAEFAKQNNIEFIGIEYIKALDEKEALNKNIAQLQFEVLEKEKKWISDTEADRLLTHGAKFR
jgi:hypothetical protein